MGMLYTSASLAGELAARVDWGKRVTLGTLVPGVVQAVNVTPGQQVAAGDPLLSLDQRSYRAQLAAAQATQKQAAILLEEARREYERAQELYDRTVLSQHELTVAEIGLRKAQAEASSAAAALARARLELDYSQLKAPFSGVVVEVNASPGQSVTAADRVPELLTLADDRNLQVTALSDAATQDGMLAAERVVVKLGGRELVAQQIVPGLEARNNGQGQLLYPVTAVIKRPDDMRVRAGESASIAW
jgi:multidrug efflux system membrane fusion protein